MTCGSLRRTAGPLRIAVLLAVTLVVALLWPPVDAPAVPGRSSANVRVIVELDAPAALAAGRGLARAVDRAEALRHHQARLVGHATDTGVDVDVVHHLTAAYNGLVVDVPGAEVDDLASMPGVRAVHDDTVYRTALTDSGPLVGAPEMWARTDANGTPVTGTGIVVAVVDTGIDYTHPDLGGGFGSGHKVVDGYDFVNDDADPMDDNGHGTHVAGIVAADGAVRGVAPDATLTAYKVLNRSGNGELSDILAGLDAAVAPDNPQRADVVNLSLSGPGDGADPLAVAADRAADSGVVVVAAAGNAGPSPQSARSPAAAEGVVAVGASVSGVRVPRARMVEPIQRDLHAVRFPISADPPETPRRMEVVDVGRGLPNSYDGLDVAGKAVLVNQTRDAAELAAYAEDRGAAAILLYFPEFWGFGANGRAHSAVEPPDVAAAGQQPLNGDSFAPGVDDGRLDDLVVMQIPGPGAAALQAHLDDDVQVEITGVDATDQLADFSSRGPTGVFIQKPDLVAPGVEILSTLPDGTYGRASGTSMAAPHVAGAAALVRQLHPAWTAPQVGAALAGTAHHLDAAGPAEQGAGRLDIPAAARTSVVPTPNSLSFGLADLSGDGIDRTRTLTLRNLSDAAVDVTLAIDPHRAEGATLTIQPDAARIQPGAEVRIQVRAELTTPAADRDVSGWVVAEVAGAAEATRVPFLLAVRHLRLHVTPDPAPEGTRTSVFVRSPADLAGPPELDVRCPGLEPQHPDARPFGSRLWRATVEVGAAGACWARATGVADDRYGGPTLTGATGFESAASPGPGRGADHWQAVGPNAEGGHLAFGGDPRRMAVVPLGSPSVFVTQDRMRTWRERRTMPVAGGSPVGVAVHPHAASTMYVAVNGGSADRTYEGKVMRTDDRGASWRVLPGRDARIDAIALDETGQTLAVVDGDGLRVTRDDGATWTEVPRAWSGVRDVHWIGQDLYLATFSGLLVVRDAAGPAPSGAEVLFRPGVLGWAGQVAGDEETILVTAYPTPWLYASHDGGATFERIFQTTGISIEQLRLVDDVIYALQPGNLWVGSDRGAHWESWGEPMPPAIEFDVGRWPDDPETSYVSAFGAGVYASRAPGEYERVGIPGAYVYDVAVAGPDGRALVAGTARDSFRTTPPLREAIEPGDLEWRSSGGEGLSGAHARFLAVSPDDPSVVYKVRTDPFLTFGIHRSDDGGATWERMSSPSEFPYALLVHPADPDRVYVSYASLTSAGLVISTDGGQSWRKVHHGRAFQAMAGDPTDPDRIWAGDHEGLYLSEDGGMSFRRIADTPVTAIAVDPDNPRHLVVGGRALYTSDDGGRTLLPAGHVDLDMWVSDLVFGDEGQVFASSTAFYDELGVLKNGRGVLASADNGTTWQSFSHGLGNTSVTSLALDREGQHLYAGTFGGSVHRIKLGDR